MIKSRSRMPIKESLNVKRISVKDLDTENEEQSDKIINKNYWSEIKKYASCVCKCSNKVCELG